MPDFTRLRAYLMRIIEVAQEDSSSVVSLGVNPAARLALEELEKQYAYVNNWIHLSKVSIKTDNITFIDWGTNTSEYAKVYFMGSSDSLSVPHDSLDYKLLSESLFVCTMNPQRNG